MVGYEGKPRARASNMRTGRGVIPRVTAGPVPQTYIRASRGSARSGKWLGPGVQPTRYRRCLVAHEIQWKTELNAQIPGSRAIVVAKDRERLVVNSALWSAAGDALGWITELSRGTSSVAFRAGTTTVSEPIAWQRNIGGRSGPRVDLPAGTYSDDTQLRLAVSRAIRGDGFFDAEAFAKIELTVWQTYSLGGGLGTKAAATNLVRRSVNWFSNFYRNGSQVYVNGGGNGAAMRIQPHVWAAAKGHADMLLNVLRNSIITHGHPQGFCGAVFHALCVAHVMKEGSIPSPSVWRSFVAGFDDVEHLIANDPQLSTFWKAAWENEVGDSVKGAIAKMQDEANCDIDTVDKTLGLRSKDGYIQVLDSLGCLTQKYRGSGFKTALAAAALALLRNEDETPAKALALAANQLESDTDTIGTMTGAILGCVATREPAWALQDRLYIVAEAKRLAAISQDIPQDSFSYPDVGRWNPPNSQTASIGLSGSGLAIAGLGQLEPVGKEYRVGDAIWQWFSLPFGQNIMAKRKADQLQEMPISQLPGPRQGARKVLERKPPEPAVQSGLNLNHGLADRRFKPSRSDERSREVPIREGIDAWTNAVIQSDFDDLVLGQLLNRCIDLHGEVEAAIAFAAIVAKAKLARQRRAR